MVLVVIGMVVVIIVIGVKVLRVATAAAARTVKTVLFFLMELSHGSLAFISSHAFLCAFFSSFSPQYLFFPCNHIFLFLLSPLFIIFSLLF